MIVADERNPKARALLEALVEALPDDYVPDDVILVIGGDGFMLHTVAEHGIEPTYLGLNAGLLGFLLNDVDDIDEVADLIVRGRYSASFFPVLQVHIWCRDGSEVVDRAINDVYLERASSQTSRLSLSIDGHEVIETLVSDGIIFATALGSTAYNFSAGGVACHPSLAILCVTPICPHVPRLDRFALPATSRARVDVLRGEHRPVRAVADGRAVENVDHVELAFAGERVKLAYFDGHDFTPRMIRKILRP